MSEQFLPMAHYADRKYASCQCDNNKRQAFHYTNFTCMLGLQVLGNSFLHQQEQPDTKVQLSTSLAGLAPCLPGQATYQTVMLMNHGDNAVQFDIQGLSQSPGYECRPER